MKFPPKYQITPEILELISKIEAQRIYFSSIILPNEVIQKIERASLLKSSLFSARIEGNPLELPDLTLGNSKDAKKLEVFNILDAIRFIEIGNKLDITTKLLKDIHAMILKDISPDAGFTRKEPSAIFNQAGQAIYIAPAPSQIKLFLNELFKFINSDHEKFPLITAFISHLIFEKIHPFLDGNGRVGRLLISAILKLKNWTLPFTVPFEEYLDSHKGEYYLTLDHGLEQTEEYLIFMLNAFHEQISAARKQLEEGIKNESFFLPPRQQEILNIIRDHSVIPFDTIRRRFLKVPERTIRYDLTKLLGKNLIEKTGETRGRFYRIKKV